MFKHFVLIGTYLNTVKYIGNIYLWTYRILFQTLRLFSRIYCFKLLQYCSKKKGNFWYYYFYSILNYLRIIIHHLNISHPLYILGISCDIIVNFTSFTCLEPKSNVDCLILLFEFKYLSFVLI